MAKRFGDERDWFLEKRFGMFIPWGIYAIPGWQEQHQWRGRVPAESYVTLKEHWNPTALDVDAWLDLAQAAAILHRIGDWYRRVKESLEDVTPASDLTTNLDVVLTRRENTLYVHLVNDPKALAVKLDPIPFAPREALLLNTGDPVSFEVSMVPTNHLEHKPYLRLRNLPLNEWVNTVPVIKLVFDRSPDERVDVPEAGPVPIGQTGQ